MSDLSADLARAYEARVAARDVELTPAAIRAAVRALGGGEGRAQVAAGNKELAGQLGISVRTVQRWQKEGGQGEARSVARSTRATPRHDCLDTYLSWTVRQKAVPSHANQTICTRGRAAVLAGNVSKPSH